jgi:hypothetical protein
LPSVEEVGDALYFVAPDGTGFRVYDVCFGPPHCEPGKRRGYNPPEPRANYRWFVGSDGVERCVRLGSERAVAPELLERQLAQSEYCATRPFDASGHAPQSA